MALAKVTRTPHLRTSLDAELRGSRMQKWPDHLGVEHLRGQSVEDVLGATGPSTMGRGISE
eukprot:5762052-Pyramimonas_sp.AAC.1